MSKKVTTFEEFKIKTMLELLAEVVARVKSGAATGLLVAVKQGDRHHGIGLLGDYLDDPSQVLPVTSRVAYRVNQLMDARLRKKKGGGKVVDFDSK